MPAGERARWRMIYDLLQGKQPGDLITYAEMGTALDLDHTRQQDKLTIQLAMRRAAKEFEIVDRHAVDAVRNVGYRVVHADEHLGLARRHQRKAGKAVVRARSKVTHVDLNEVTDPAARAALELAAVVLSRQEDMMRTFSIRQARLERTVEMVTKQTGDQAQRTDDQLNELRERLARLESRSSDG
jgi:hypothetical protein